MTGKERFSLKGRTALLTGASGILGQHFARGLAEAEANVALFDINPEVTDLAQKISSETGVQAKGYVCNLRDPEQVKTCTHTAIQDFGGIQVLHNNAAGKTEKLEDFLAPFEKYDLKTWQEIMSINVDSMFLMAQAIGQHMLENGGGSIVQTSSIYGIMGPDKRIYAGSEYNGQSISSPAIYSASKAAVVGLTKYLATYWGDKNIRVNTLTPGGVESGQNDTFKEKYSARIPMGRMADADDMVGALIYLASDASRYVTGQNIVVDGGLSAW